MSELALVQEVAVVPECTTPVPPAAVLADISPAQKVEQRYVDAINVLMKDAVDKETLHILADVLTWALGRVIVGYGTTAVAGDVMRRLGGYVCDLVERKDAQEEAERARKEGRKHH